MKQEKIKDNLVVNTSFLVSGKGPSYKDLGRARALARGEDIGKEPVRVTHHRFHFCVGENDDVLVMWFCSGKLYQKQMDTTSAKSLCDSLERNGFKLEELN